MLKLNAPADLAEWVAQRVRARNPVVHDFFEREAPRLARACQSMADRFARGGRVYAFGRGPYATDAAHISVEFVHPVIVGKRALPAMDASIEPAAWLETLVGPDDMVVGFGPPEGDVAAVQLLARLRDRGAMTFALPGLEGDADYAVAAPTVDPHVHQELFEILGHTLYESVHVFFEHRELGHDVGASGFLYPYLGTGAPQLDGIVEDVADSIRAKARDGARLREELAVNYARAIGAATTAIADRLANGGTLLAFGNGGSATDATDFAIDCVAPSAGMRPVRAVSLAAEPAILSAISNDVGVELVFLRQLIAQSGPHDVAFAFSTSGGSKNVVAALAEARRRGLLTVALLGYDGGEIARSGLADHAIVVHCDYIPRIQETQAAVYHVLREGLDRLGRDAA
ncbi:MAG: SIS domain-containing protein [Vulcanimicrobiaceae bacterium]